MKKPVLWIILAVIVLCGIGAAVVLLSLANGAPANPPVVQEPAWDSPQTRELAKRACFDCHSNETVWPFYSQIPPVSLLVQRDVNEGRKKLNFSQWGSGKQEIDEAIEAIESGEMPMPIYLIMHPEASLSDADKQALITGIQATFGVSGEGERRNKGED